MFDDGQAQARTTGGAGAGRVHAVEALEDALPVLLRDADALVGHGYLDEVPAGRGDAAARDADPGPGRGVVDRVLDEVAEGGGELAAVSPHVQVRRAARGHRDLLGGRGVAGAVDGLGHQLVDPDRLGILQRVVVLHPGQVDELLDQIGQPVGLDLHPAREAGDRLGVVRGVHDGLGEQGERADRRLQLMADVGDEVAPDHLDAPGLGQVLDQQQHEAGAERGDPGGDRQGLAAAGAPARKIQLHLPYLTVTAGVAGHVEHRLHGQLPAPDQPQCVRRGAGLDHRVALVEHHRRGAEHREHGVHAGRQDRVRVQGCPGGPRLVALAPAERQHGDDAGAQPGDRCSCGDRRVHVHASRLCVLTDTLPAIRVPARTFVAQSSPW